MATPLSRAVNSGLVTPPGHCSYRRLYDKRLGAFTRALPDADGSVHLRVFLADIDLGVGPEVEQHHNLDKVVGEAEPLQRSESASRQRIFEFDK